VDGYSRIREYVLFSIAKFVSGKSCFIAKNMHESIVLQPRS
jgi:hypothetical protein